MVIEDDGIKQIRTRFEKLAWALDECMRRLFAAAAAVLGHGGITRVAQTTEVSRRAIYAGLDGSSNPSGIKISNAEFESIRITRNEFHGEWNYRIDPDPG